MPYTVKLSTIKPLMHSELSVSPTNIERRPAYMGLWDLSSGNVNNVMYIVNYESNELCLHKVLTFRRPKDYYSKIAAGGALLVRYKANKSFVYRVYAGEEMMKVITPSLSALHQEYSTKL